MEVRRLAILGTGLIGASVGLAAKRAGVGSVVGYDFVEATAEAARERGAIDSIAIDTHVDLVVVAVPVIALPTVIASVLDEHDRATVTDVGSTKAGVVASVPDPARFVGGHPVTGSEARGPEH